MSKKLSVYSADSAYQGVKGKAVMILMKVLHRPMHRQLTGRMHIKPDDRILDVGCGSGTLIALMGKQTSGMVTGIDYSPHMVRAAEAENAGRIAEGSMQVLTASVSSLPLEDASVDKATAFETIQFWPDIENDLKEVYRVLTASGALYIANRFPKPGSRWYDWVKLKTEENYRRVLTRAGFTRILVDSDEMKNMIVIEAYKK